MRRWLSLTPKERRLAWVEIEGVPLTSESRREAVNPGRLTLTYTVWGTTLTLTRAVTSR